LLDPTPGIIVQVMALPEAMPALGALDRLELEQRKAALDRLFTLAASNNPSVQVAVAEALGAITPGDAKQRQAVLVRLVTLAASGDPQVQGGVAEALGAITPGDAKQRQAVVDTLVALAKGNVWSVQTAVARALGAITPGDAEQRRTVMETLVTLAASNNPWVQRAVARALGALTPDDAEQRRAVLETLVTLAADRDTDVRKGVASALLRTGPLEARQTVQLLAHLHADHSSAGPQWRAMGWAFVGGVTGQTDGPTLMAFLGRPHTLPTERLVGNPLDAAQVLRLFASVWPSIETSHPLQNEIAGATSRIIRAACPLAAPAENSNPVGAIGEVATREWVRTLTWLRGWFGGHDDGRCWRGETRKTLEQLRDNFTAAPSGRLHANGQELKDHLAADGAAPVLGQAMFFTSGWFLFWFGFLALFPYSHRVRAAYLFNEKTRGALSVWFVPLILILVPPLRRHLLRAFRDDLLADARLAAINEAEWYAGLRVRNRDGLIQPITTAVPDFRGTLLLVGESGLGKSTFLRILANRSRRTVAFLNAHSCDRGVEEAIVERVGGFQSTKFFRGLIYPGDLAVIIDGLNEVDATVRAGIVAFTNRAGRANLMIATQPNDGLDSDHRSPFTRASLYELLPLAREDISAFLKSRPARNDPANAVRGDNYDRAVDRLLAEVLDAAPADGPARQTEEERRTTELVLSNPMDLTYASELIALGRMPRPSQMIEQAFALACASYRRTHDRDFPTRAFARAVVELRREDRNWLAGDEFPAEQGVLQDFRLIVPRPLDEKAGRQEIVLRFRHDKVMDVLMKPAFEADPRLQIELINDPRFRGIYLLFAQIADRALARRLRDLLVSRAAQTGENGLSNEFVRRFDLVSSPGSDADPGPGEEEPAEPA
jgi:ribosomal protein L17